jgi:hypothetical protein
MKEIKNFSNKVVMRVTDPDRRHVMIEVSDIYADPSPRCGECGADLPVEEPVVLLFTVKETDEFLSCVARVRSVAHDGYRRAAPGDRVTVGDNKDVRYEVLGRLSDDAEIVVVRGRAGAVQLVSASRISIVEHVKS